MITHIISQDGIAIILSKFSNFVELSFGNIQLATAERQIKILFGKNNDGQ